MTMPDDFTGGYTNQPPPPYMGSPMYGNGPQNGLGIAALTVGVLAILLGLFLIGGVLGVVAIGLGIAGRMRVRQGLATNPGVATAGIVTGALGVMLAVLSVVLFVIVGLKVLHSTPVRDFKQCISSNKTQQAACEQKLGINPTATAS